MLNWIHVNSSRWKLLLINACISVVLLSIDFATQPIHIYISCAHSQIKWKSIWYTFGFVKFSHAKRIVRHHENRHPGRKLFRFIISPWKLYYMMGLQFVQAVEGELFMCLDILCAWPMLQNTHVYIWKHTQLLSNFNQNRIECNFWSERKTLQSPQRF